MRCINYIVLYMPDPPHGAGNVALSSTGLATWDAGVGEPDRDRVSGFLSYQSKEAGTAHEWDGRMPCFRDIALHGLFDDYGIAENHRSVGPGSLSMKTGETRIIQKGGKRMKKVIIIDRR